MGSADLLFTFLHCWVVFYINLIETTKPLTDNTLRNVSFHFVLWEGKLNAIYFVPKSLINLLFIHSSIIMTMKTFFNDSIYLFERGYAHLWGWEAAREGERESLRTLSQRH